MAQIQLTKNEQMPEFKFKNPQLSVKNSVEYMKKITVVAVSSVLFLRDIFPATTFSERRIEDLKVKILRCSDEIPSSKTMTDWIKCALEAVEANFLKKMILVIEKGDEVENTLEAYTFTFNYKRDAILCHIEDIQENTVARLDKVPEDIAKATRQMIRSVLMTTQNMEPLPDNAQISMRLEFNNLVPEDYQMPEHFKSVDSLGINFPENAQTYKLGKLDTKFTSIAMTSKFVVKEDGDEGEEEGEGESLEVDDVMVASQPESNNQYRFAVKTAPTESTQPDNLSHTLSSLRLKGEVKCICDCDDNIDDNLKCNACANYQHRACYKILGKENVPKHICVNCHEPENPAKMCQDLQLVEDPNRKEGAVYRRALMLCLTGARVSTNTFMSQLHVTRQAANQIINHLEIDGCLQPPSGRGKNRLVNIDNLKENILSLHFNMPAREDDIAEMETEERPVPPRQSIGRKRDFNKDEDKQNHPELQPKRFKSLGHILPRQLTRTHL